MNLLDFFYNTEHAGEIAANALVKIGRAGSIEQNNLIIFYCQLENNFIINIKFQAFGSALLIAGGEYLCRYLHGKNQSIFNQLTLTTLMQDLNLPPLKMPLVHLLWTALQQLKQTEK